MTQALHPADGLAAGWRDRHVLWRGGRPGGHHPCCGLCDDRGVAHHRHHRGHVQQHHAAYLPKVLVTPPGEPARCLRGWHPEPLEPQTPDPLTPRILQLLVAPPGVLTGCSTLKSLIA